MMGNDKPEIVSEFTKAALLILLRIYKYAVSPLFPPSCRYVPSCSEFAMEAVERYGALRGTYKAVVRLLRCHPLARGGYDPVVRNNEPSPPTYPQSLRKA